MTKKAYIVYVSVATRVVVDIDSKEEEEILAASIPQLIFNLKDQGIEAIESYEEDLEIPYNPNIYPDKKEKS